MPGGSDLMMLLDVLASLRKRIVNPPAMRKFALNAVGVPEADGVPEARAAVVVADVLVALALALLAADVEILAMEVALAFGVPGRIVAAGVISCDPATDEPDDTRAAGGSVMFSFCEKSGRMTICV